MCDVISETDTFSSTVTGESFKINHKFNCNDKCLVYLATCKICNKQYTGQTIDSFTSRWNNYKSKSRKFDRNEKCRQEYLYSHLKVREITVFWKMCQWPLSIKLMALIPRKGRLFGYIRLKH